MRNWPYLILAAALLAPQAASASSITINATFDASVPTALRTEINNAISIYQSTFTDPITVSILFRYGTTAPDGSALDPGLLAQSNYSVYSLPYATYINALTADGKTASDASAIANLPGASAFPNTPTRIDVQSADGRAVGIGLAGILAADGSVNTGGTFDGIVTLNSNQPFVFDRSLLTPSTYDAQQSVEHEMDEVLGLGSLLPFGSDFTRSNAIKPEDLFRYSSAGTISFDDSGTATSYFSIDGGTTNLVGFNQESDGDYGDWLSPNCSQSPNLPQYAFTCPGGAGDISGTSVEGIALDVVGYDLATTPEPGTFALLGSGGLALLSFLRRRRN